MSEDKEKPKVDLAKQQSEGSCVICGKPQEARYRPFCSKRCAEVDLGRWLTGSYRVETEEPAADEEPEYQRGGHA